MPFQAEYEKRVSMHSYRTVLRRIDLAKKTYLVEHPSLMVLGQTRVLILKRFLPKNQKAGRFLTKKGLETTIDVGRKKEIHEFQKVVDGLIEKLNSIKMLTQRETINHKKICRWQKRPPKVSEKDRLYEHF